MRYVVTEPKKLSLDRIFSIYRLIEQGGQIKLAPSVLLKQICSCELIGFMKDDFDTTHAIAAIKIPQETYTKKVFENAGIKDGARQNYKNELGYCVTDEEYKGQGVCKELVLRLLEKTSAARLFATTQSQIMASILLRQNFRFGGDTHTTEDNRKIDLLVYEV